MFISWIVTNGGNFKEIEEPSLTALGDLDRNDPIAILSRLCHVGDCYFEQVVLSRTALSRYLQNKKSQNNFFFDSLKNFAWIQPQSEDKETEKTILILLSRFSYHECSINQQQLDQILVLELAAMFQKIFVWVFSSFLKR